MSAIVLAALVVMWAVVLVPMFLRRHERTHELASAHRFAGAMRVLSRRRSAAAAPELTAGERRAQIISRALGSVSSTVSSTVSGHVPARPSRPAAPATRPVRRTAGDRRAARVAARRRGLMVVLSAVALTGVLAVVLGGWLIAVQAATDVFALAGLAQLRASALADRAARPVRRLPARAEVRLTTAPATPRVAPAPVEAPLPVEPPLPEPVAAPVRRRVGKQIVFDAVTEMPPVTLPRVREQVARRLPRPAPVAAGIPEDFYERPMSPPRPERVHVPLLDPVDTDPDTLTSGLELLDGILGVASGE